MLKIAMNITMKCEQALIHLRVLFAWATKFNRKCVGPIGLHDTKLGRGSLHPGFFFGGGRGWTLLDRAGQTRFSRSARKASEICLRASEKTVGESLTGLLPRPNTRIQFFPTNPSPMIYQLIFMNVRCKPQRVEL